MKRDVITLARLRSLTPDEAAALWIVRRSEGLSPGEQALFEEWLDSSADNARAWTQAEDALRCIDRGGDDELLLAMRQHALEARRSVWISPQLLALAASLLLVVCGSLFFGSRWIDGMGAGSGPMVAQTERFGTGRGDIRDIILADGTRMTLDAQSVAEVRFTPTARDVRLLQGRALFKTAADQTRPFAVMAAERQLVALGTLFDVRLRTGELQVTLIEGRVAVSRAGSAPREAVLEPGQQFVGRGTVGIVRTPEAGVDEALDWRSGFLTFRNDTLLAAAAELNRHSKVQLLIRDAAVGRLRVTGRFRSGDAERFARALTDIHPVRIVRRAPEQLELVMRR